ncbi:MAG: phage integrase SAM-like domain-containing protein, partial [Bacteroidota bacterium]
MNFRKPKSNTPKSEVLGVVLNYYYQKKKLRKSIGVEVKLKDWNFDEQEYPVRKSDPHYKTKNLSIRQKLVEIGTIIQKIEINGQFPTVELVNYHLIKVLEKKEEKTKKDYDFFVVVEEYIKEIKGDSRLSNNYIRNFVASLTQIKIYIKEDLNRTYFPLRDIDEDFQNDYYQYSIKKKERGNVTVKKHINHLRKFLRWSVKNRFTNYL